MERRGVARWRKVELQKRQKYASSLSGGPREPEDLDVLRDAAVEERPHLEVRMLRDC